MALHDERQRLEALKLAVQRKVGAFGKLDAEQREWLAAWREDQPPVDYATMINNAGEVGDGLRSDIRRVLYGDVPTILVTDTDAQANEKWQRFMGR
ncbi:hypothetical protein [Mesorhizobium sp. B2-5-7]|uniref:hypothetical protein n=1 Tax=Mesorhizobium sp. B2-5-7 TaxID=2589923 RepID=UPI00112836A8|nr:hypothetical protein [Mesorhizobium sp. B2-5-7]TPK17743.1 hypothetical protein FJ543_04340 [Mesorhizobium sp. B2-5-7]